MTENALRAAEFGMEADAVSTVRKRAAWSPYVVRLVENMQKSMRQHLTVDQLRFLLYPSNLTESDTTQIRKCGAGVVWL
jgi:hypothetical protein